MRRHWKLCALAAAAGAFVLGAFVGTSFGSGPSGYSAPATVMPSHASPAGNLVSAKGGGVSPRSSTSRRSRARWTHRTSIWSAPSARRTSRTRSPGASSPRAWPDLCQPVGRRTRPERRIGPQHLHRGPTSSLATLQWKPEVVCGKEHQGLTGLQPFLKGGRFCFHAKAEAVRADAAPPATTHTCPSTAWPVQLKAGSQSYATVCAARTKRNRPPA